MAEGRDSDEQFGSIKGGVVGVLEDTVHARKLHRSGTEPCIYATRRVT